jgi:hypothetical protein
MSTEKVAVREQALPEGQAAVTDLVVKSIAAATTTKKVKHFILYKIVFVVSWAILKFVIYIVENYFWKGILCLT